MAIKNKSLKAVFSDGQVYKGESTYFNNEPDYPGFGFDASRILGMTCPRGEDSSREVSVYKFDIKNCELVESLAWKGNINIDLEPMTQKEFDQETQTRLSETPREFHKFLKFILVDDRSFEEQLSELEEILSEFLPSLKEYNKRFLIKKN